MMAPPTITTMKLAGVDETDGGGNATAIYSPFFLPNRLQARRDPVNRLQDRFGQRLGLRVISRVAKMLQ